MLLDKIIEDKKTEVNALRDQFKFIKLANLAEAFPPVRDFKSAINKPGKISLIAEIKKASPSAGVIVENFNHLELAKTYEQSGAAALSVLTDTKHFQGWLRFLKEVKEKSTIPVLRKDFVIDELQIMESRLAGADALLLIARILDGEKLSAFVKKCQEISLWALVEAHDEKDVEKALASGAHIIGINNRDLDTLKVDIKTSLSLVSKYPELKSKVLVSESGITGSSQINELKSAGFNAVLIGETLLKSQNIPGKIKELFS